MNGKTDNFEKSSIYQIRQKTLFSLYCYFSSLLTQKISQQQATEKTQMK
jgi:hypothetical protein